MAGTRATESEAHEQVRSLAGAIQHVDTKYDSRDCPHECHGTLTVIEESGDNIVICESCRCTPDGVYYPPETNERKVISTVQPQGFTGGKQPSRRYDERTLRDYQPLHPYRRSPDRGGHPWADHDRERYRHSGRVKLVGGFERAWPQEQTSRDDSLI